jgi:hypothetical protein
MKYNDFSHLKLIDQLSAHLNWHFQSLFQEGPPLLLICWMGIGIHIAAVRNRGKWQPVSKNTLTASTYLSVSIYNNLTN